jgi:hypothetical protein
LASADVGSTVRVLVTASNGAGSSSASSDPTGIVAAAAVAPSNTSAPSISGTAQEAQTLSADVGSWSGTPPISYAYQWRRCDSGGAGCIDIVPAAAAAYTLTSADVGSTIRVVVTGSNSAGSSSASSAASAVVTAAPVAPSNTSLPSISGTAQEAQTLSADVGSWSGTAPISYASQWRRCDAGGGNCSDIAGATGSTYTLASADVGSTIRVVVTASNSAGSSSASSAATGVVTAAAVAPSNTSPPAISGTAQEAQTLSADVGSWSGTAPISYASQWRRCDSAGASCADIAGATGSTYALVTGDVGSTIRVVVTASNSAGSSSASSAATGVVTAAAVAPSNTVLPSISGTAQEAQTLSADVGSWSGTAPISYASQWRRCDAGGASCADIGGATGSTYTLVASDVGSTIRVVVTGSNSAGSSSASSAATGVVTAAAVAPSNTSAPSISGTTQVGQTLSADVGSWSGTAPISYVYQWRRCDSGGASCADIAGATGSTYTLVTADGGSTIRVVVTASNSAGSSGATSAQTAVVPVPTRPANTSLPTITGTPLFGNTLTANQGVWTGTPPPTYTYQWRRCNTTGGSCVDIAGASSATYVVASADVSTTLRVTVTATNVAGSAAASSAATAIVGGPGYRDGSSSGAGTAPTGSKPESKLWWNDGSWWASMWSTSTSTFRIYKLNTATQTWTNTGTQLDNRTGTRADILWDGTHLYVASHVFSTCGCSTSSPGLPSRLYRYSYNAATKTYALDAGFPVSLNDTSTETLVIDKDSTGMLWATWAQDNQVMVTHSVGGDDQTWVTPYVLPDANASGLKTDDISTLVSYGGNKIGVMWSNQSTSAIYFASHTDGAADTAWTTVAAVKSSKIADDHINIKSLQADGSGRVFAVTKTSINDTANPNPNDPQVLLLSYAPGSGWSFTTVWRIQDGGTNGVTRPILLIDVSNSVLHLFATSSDQGGVIYEKTSPVNAISFVPGNGSLFMKDPTSNNLNNATSTKQDVTSASGIVILASNDSTHFYWHNYEPLP